MINSICNNCNNCNAVTRLPGLQPPLPSPWPILSCPLPYAAPQRLPGRGAVPKLPSAMGNGEPSLNCLLPPQEFSISRMKKRLRLWLTKLISLLVYTNYIDIKWRVKNYRNIKKKTKSSRRNSKCASLMLDFLFFVIAYSSHRLTANLHFRLQEHRMSLKYCCCAFVS